MVTPLRSTNTIDFHRAREQVVAESRNAELLESGEEQARFRLLSRLQTTLSLERIIQLFYEELDDDPAPVGLRYVHEARGLQILEGRTASHSCGYRLHTRQGDLGELILYRDHRLSEAELARVESLLMTLVHPLRNALQYRDVLDASVTDPLTGAGNRSGLDTALDREIGLARRYGLSLSVLMIDIDQFKQINDKHGHSAGDAVLRETVQRFHTVCRNTDICFRYGGEEFVIVLSRTDHEGAVTIADRIRSSIADHPFRHANRKLDVTISIGISDFQAIDDRNSLITRADQALYESKKEGGNRVQPL